MTDDGSAAPLSSSGLEAPLPSKAVLPLRKTGTDAYVELHARSAFSFLEGASLPEELIARCAQLDQPAIALADAQGVYGAPRFHMASKTAGLRALIGAEVATPDGGRYTLLAENQRGYQKPLPPYHADTDAGGPTRKTKVSSSDRN
jgi:DNA polymerase III alpha subunit